MEKFGGLIAFLKLAFVFAAGVLAAKLFLAFTTWLLLSTLLLFGIAGGFLGIVLMTFFGILFGLMAVVVFFIGCSLGGVALNFISKGVNWVRSFFSDEEKTDESTATPEAAAAA